MNLRNFVDEHAPGLIDIVRPITYDAPPGYPKLRDISYRMCLPVITMCLSSTDQEHPPTQELVNAYMTVMKAAQGTMPTLYVTEECLKELLVQELPASTKLS